MSDNTTKVIIEGQDKTGQAFASVKGGLNSISSSYSSLTRVMGASVAGFSIVQIAKSSIDAADALKDLSDRTGVAVKDLASIELAADQSGTSLEGVAKAIGKLSLSTGQAQQGDKEMAASLQRLGVNATDPLQRLLQLADAVQKNGTGTKNLADLQKVLGKSYEETLPLLLQGGDALRQSALDSESYADAMARMAPDADAFNDQLAQMKTNFAGVSATLVSTMLPSLNQYVGALNEILARGSLLDKIKFFTVGYINPDVADKVTDYTVRTAQLREEIKRLRDNGEDASAVIERLHNLIIAQPQKFNKPPAITDTAAEMNCIARGGTWDGKSCKAKASGGKSAADKIYDKNRAQDKRNSGVDFDTDWSEIERADDAIRKNRDELVALKAEYISLIDPVETFRKKLDEIDRLELSGVFSGDQATEARFAINEQIDALNEVKDTGKDAYADLTRAVEGWGRESADAIVDFAFTGETSFSGMVDSMLKDLARMAVYKNVSKPIFDSFGGSDIGSAMASFFGGGRAAGGPVSPGQYYVVGENGPEILLPNTSGTVIPNKALGGGGNSYNVVVSVDATGGKVAGDAGQANELGRRIESAVRGVLLAEKRPGGMLAA